MHGSRFASGREPRTPAVPTPSPNARRRSFWQPGRDRVESRSSGVESLTPSERRVAQMAAEGSTNRRIAQDLFVTTKTVEVHLSSVYRKLDIASRTQLAAALAGTPVGENQGGES